MQRYDWEATAFCPEIDQRMWLHGQFELDVSNEKRAMSIASALAQDRAASEGCDIETVEEVQIQLTDCSHANFEENPMDGSGTCLDCGKYLKGFAD
ncbi:UNVERIFIED_ORG: hypothetical protein ABID57_000661 [Arthrobacter sp. UYEF1]